jgi:PKD repeat protein
VTLDGSGSSDPEGIVDYEWDLGDGGSAYGETATHTYTAAGTYEVTLYVFDTAGLNDSASLTITVVVNTAPVAEGQTVNTQEDAVTPITLTATDAEGDALSYAVVALPAHGELTGAGPDVVYTPDENYYGTDQFSFKASDGKLESNTATVNINVVPMNDAPVALDQSVSTTVGKPVDIVLAATDADGDAVSYSIVDLPPNGSVLSDDGDRYVTYSPNDGFSGEDTFTFVATDGLADSNTATVTVDVSGNFIDIVSVSTGKPYSLATAEVGALHYIDRSYMIKELSANLDGMVLVRTANNDKRVKTEQHLTLQLGQDAVLSVCYDKRASAIPNWLASGWALTGEVMAVSDKKASPMLVYEKTVTAGQVVLGGNLASGASGAKSNYVVIARPVTAAMSAPKGIRFVVGPLAPTEWLNDGDTDGDGLKDEFEALYGVDPEVVDTDDDGTPDEAETGPDGRSLWDIHEEWVDDNDGPDDGSDGGSGGGGSGGGCFLSTASLTRNR